MTIPGTRASTLCLAPVHNIVEVAPSLGLQCRRHVVGTGSLEPAIIDELSFAGHEQRPCYIEYAPLDPHMRSEDLPRRSPICKPRFDLLYH